MRFPSKNGQTVHDLVSENENEPQLDGFVCQDLRGQDVQPGQILRGVDGAATVEEMIPELRLVHVRIVISDECGVLERLTEGLGSVSGLLIDEAAVLDAGATVWFGTGLMRGTRSSRQEDVLTSKHSPCEKNLLSKSLVAKTCSCL